MLSAALLSVFKESALFYPLLITLISFIIYFFIEYIYYKKEIVKILASIIKEQKLPLKIKKMKGIFSGIEELLIMVFDELSLKTYELKELAFKDPLTRFYNLLYLEEHLKDIMSTFTNEKISIFMIDIDKFKEINDTFGHIAGDHYLKEFSDELRKSLKKVRTLIFRYGGDEFLIFIDDEFEKSKNLMEKIRKIFEEKEILIDNKKLKTTISIGGGEFRWEELKNIENILKTLDKKLYKAKETRNTLYV